MKEKAKILTVFLTIVLITSLSLNLFLFHSAFSKEKKLSSQESIYKYLKLFSQVLSLVENEYVQPVSAKKLIYGAINGMLRTLDPYSCLMTPDEYKELEIETKGSFTGIGIEITIQDDILTVVAPIEDTPAWRAGIKPGDKILKIDGKPTKGMSLMEAVKLLRGPKGTKVTLTILRNDKTIKVITLTRDVIPIRSVKYKFVAPHYAYVRITSFQENTPKELEKALNKLERKEKVKGLILDLRYNPGGLLSSAIKVADEFLNKGIIVSVKGRTKDSQMVFKAHPNPPGEAHHYPIVVIINRGTASAAEILTGALKDNRRAVVIGQRSFGKGRVQSVIPLGDGYAVKLTTAFYYTPNGKCIDKIGIQPDIQVPDVDLAKIKAINSGTSLENKKKMPLNPFKLWSDPKRDLQVKMALSILKHIDAFAKLRY